MKPCGCDDSWKCPEHSGVKIPVKSSRRKIGIPPYWRGFLEAMGMMGVLFLALKIVENWK